MSATEISEIYLGKIVKAFGVRGELKFLASEDFWFGVLESQVLSLRWRENGELRSVPLHVERARPHGGTFVVKAKGVDDRNEAETYVGRELFVDLEQLDVDLPDEERPFQVIGFTVKLEDGRELGTVTSVLFSAAHDVYEVSGTDGVVLIPAVEEFIVSRDNERKEMTVRPIPGLIDG